VLTAAIGLSLSASLPDGQVDAGQLRISNTASWRLEVEDGGGTDPSVTNVTYDDLGARSRSLGANDDSVLAFDRSRSQIVDRVSLTTGTGTANRRNWPVSGNGTASHHIDIARPQAAGIVPVLRWENVAETNSDGEVFHIGAEGSLLLVGKLSFDANTETVIVTKGDMVNGSAEMSCLSGDQCSNLAWAEGEVYKVRHCMTPSQRRHSRDECTEHHVATLVLPETVSAFCRALNDSTSNNDWAGVYLESSATASGHEKSLAQTSGGLAKALFCLGCILLTISAVFPQFTCATLWLVGPLWAAASLGHFGPDSPSFFELDARHWTADLGSERECKAGGFTRANNQSTVGIMLGVCLVLAYAFLGLLAWNMRRRTEWEGDWAADGAWRGRIWASRLRMLMQRQVKRGAVLLSGLAVMARLCTAVSLFLLYPAVTSHFYPSHGGDIVATLCLIVALIPLAWAVFGDGEAFGVDSKPIMQWALIVFSSTLVVALGAAAQWHMSMDYPEASERQGALPSVLILLVTGGLALLHLLRYLALLYHGNHDAVERTTGRVLLLTVVLAGFHSLLLSLTAAYVAEGSAVALWMAVAMIGTIAHTLAIVWRHCMPSRQQQYRLLNANNTVDSGELAEDLAGNPATALDVHNQL